MSLSTIQERFAWLLERVERWLSSPFSRTACLYDSREKFLSLERKATRENRQIKIALQTAAKGFMLESDAEKEGSLVSCRN